MKMKFTFDTRIFLLICCLLQGLAGLRLIKVSIPAYKLRGESAMLECQYELDRPYGSSSTNSRTTARNRYNHNGGGAGGNGGAAENGNDMNYIETDADGEEPPVYRHTRTHAYQQQQREEQQQQQQQHQRQRRLKRQQQQQQQQHYQQYQYQYQPSHSSSSGAFYQQQQYEQQQQQQQQEQHSYEQQQQQQQQQQPYEYQYQTQKSPYGHSVYRGSAFSSSIAAASAAAGAAGGRLGASTYTGYGQRAAIDAATHEDSFGDSDEDDGDDEDAAMGNAKVKEEALYAIKWYKDNEEFYRYVPKANPQKTSYRFDGVRVVEEHSDSARVLLRGLTLNSSGLYRCEISAEAPNFSSVQGEARMDIVYLPRDGPHIKGQQFQYQIGETLNLNCTSGKSHPASHLQWFINEQPVLDGRYLVPYNDTVHKHGLITSTLGLQLTVDARHFHNGAMRVKCLASISPVLWKGGQESVLQRRPGIIDNREAMLLVRSAASGLHAQQQLHPMRNFLSGLRLLTIVAILTTLCQLQLRAELT